MSRRIGSTTYRVKVIFNDTAKETMEEKIIRLIRFEA
ncbi:MAG: transposon-encoded TnpW family protein, partial [Clostridia bacterium]|nr:transposon-encoded TnpW family protein [Clostridia bacterium]